jgi:hypothetical protein
MSRNDVVNVLKSHGIILPKNVEMKIPKVDATKVKVLHSRRYGISITKD